MNGTNLESTTASNITRFGVAEQAINAIYLLAAQPDVLSGEIVKEKTRAVFQKENRFNSTQEPQETCDTESSTLSLPGLSSVRSLSQLLFIVGHIASKYQSVPC